MLSLALVFFFFSFFLLIFTRVWLRTGLWEELCCLNFFFFLLSTSPFIFFFPLWFFDRLVCKDTLLAFADTEDYLQGR